MIEVSHLTKRYGVATAVDDVSFRVEAGRVTGFLGPNGAGKSTTMRMVLGLERPSAGTALVDGVPYARLASPLTEREREVLVAIGAGLSNPEIAASLHLSESTVKTHVGRVLAKLHLRDRVHAVIWAYDHGLAGGAG